MDKPANQKRLYTTHEVARLLGVTPITVIRWIDGGKFKCFTTVGGHRRIEHEELARFAQEYNLPWQGEDELTSRKDFVILAVDDEPDLLAILHDILTSIPGVSVIEASNGFTAGAKLVEEHPDLVFLDFMMPELDGFEFMKFVRQDPRFKDLPIIAVTALKGDADQERIRHSGVTDIIFKPFTFSEMKRTVDRMMLLKQRSSHNKPE